MLLIFERKTAMPLFDYLCLDCERSVRTSSLIPVIGLPANPATVATLKNCLQPILHFPELQKTACRDPETRLAAELILEKQDVPDLPKQLFLMEQILFYVHLEEKKLLKRFVNIWV